MPTSDKRPETSPAKPADAKANSSLGTLLNKLPAPTELWTTLPPWCQWVVIGVVVVAILFLVTGQVIALVSTPRATTQHVKIAPSKEDTIEEKADSKKDELQKHAKETLAHLKRMTGELQRLQQLEKETKDVQAKITQLRHDAKELGKLTSQHKQTLEGLPKEVAKVTARQVGAAFRLGAGEPVNGLRTDVSELTETVGQLQDQLRRETTPRDVAIVVYHAKDISAYPILRMIKTLVLSHPYEKSYPRYRLGVYTASDSKITPIAPLGWSDVAKPSVGKKKKRQINFSPSLSDRTQHTEDVDQLDVNKTIFENAKAPKRQGVRKCVLVVSSKCSPPKAADGFKNTEVSVIIAHHVFDKKKATNSTPHWMAWEEFCRQRGGGAVSVTLHVEHKANQAPSIPLEDQRALVRRLRWLISPL